MSYILDALRKSEQERGHGAAPSVQTLHTSGISYHSSKTHLWPYLLLAAIVINLGALMYFIVADDDAEPGVPPLAQHANNGNHPARLAPTSIDLVMNDMPASGSPRQAVAVVAEDTIYKPVTMPAVSTPVVEAPPPAVVTPVSFNTQQSPIVERDELPAEIQQHIPIMEFSAHVYSSNPMHRSIVINGRFMEEGDQLASDLMLSEITPKGAIFDFQGQLFHQSVISAWN